MQFKMPMTIDTVLGLAGAAAELLLLACSPRHSPPQGKTWPPPGQAGDKGLDPAPPCTSMLSTGVGSG